MCVWGGRIRKARSSLSPAEDEGGCACPTSGSARPGSDGWLRGWLLLLLLLLLEQCTRSAARLRACAAGGRPRMWPADAAPLCRARSMDAHAHGLSPKQGGTSAAAAGAQ